MILIILVTISCGGPPKKTFPETQPNIQDNGKNLCWLTRSAPTKLMDSLQEWIDEHPDKRITAITTVMYHGYHRVFSYLFVYEKR